LKAEAALSIVRISVGSEFADFHLKGARHEAYGQKGPFLCPARGYTCNEVPRIEASEGMKSMAVELTPARLGKTVVIRGEVKGSEDLIIDGHVEGAIALAENRLTIGPNADVLADLSARDVLIQGRLKGNIVATGRVELRAGSAVEGDVRAFRLAIEDNAVFRGKVDLTQGATKKPDGPNAPANGVS
jgi:cytoskeletal protein CcmA (bactofilin family)